MRLASRLLSGSTCALIVLAAASCGRTDSVLVFDSVADEVGTFSYEDTADTIADDDTAEVTTEDDSTDWGTGEWGEEAPDTWGEEDDPDIDTFDSFETFDSTDIDTFDTFDTFETDDFDTTDTDTATTDTDTDTTTTDTDTDTTTTDTDTDTTTTDTDTDTTTTDTDTDTTATATDTTASTTDPGPGCDDAVMCLLDCGNFSNMCTGPCTSELDPDAQSAFFDLQICAIQSCFFLAQCDLGDFNAPECVACRLSVNDDPAGFGCDAEGLTCGL